MRQLLVLFRSSQCPEWERIAISVERTVNETIHNTPPPVAFQKQYNRQAHRRQGSPGEGVEGEAARRYLRITSTPDLINNVPPALPIDPAAYV